MDETFCILTFKSIHHVIKGEHILKTIGIWTDMIPSPRGITSDCGMSIKVRCSDLRNITGMLIEGNEPEFTMFRQDGSDYKKIEEGNQYGNEGSAY